MTKDAKQFLKEARNESGVYHNRLWVEVNELHSIYILKLQRVTFNTEEESDNLVHLHYCGYVGIPKSHPLYRKMNDFGGNAYDVDDNIIDDVYAHGGITFTGHMKEWGRDYFFIGFDCAHVTDACSVAELSKDTMINGATFKSWDFAKAWMIKLYNQLSKIESESFVVNMMKKEDEFYAKKPSQTP